MTPHAIDGTVGSKIRIILGETGNNWLLLLNHDDGNSKWQEQQWSGIPYQLSRQINNCIAKDRYIEEVDFGPDGEWYVRGIKRDGSGGHSWWGSTEAGSSIKEKDPGSHRVQVSFGSDVNPASYGYNDDDELETYAIIEGRNGYQLSNNIDDDLSSRIRRINKRNKTINFIRLFTDSGYFISDDEGTAWKGVGVDCAKHLEENGKEEDFSLAGDGSWVIIRSNRHTTSTGVDDELLRHLNKFYNDQGRREDIRNLEIEEYPARIRREEEAREREEQEEQQRVERLASEAAEREALERRHAIEAVAFRERQEQREATEREERERASSSRLTPLLVERINEEIKDIVEQENRLKLKRCQESRDNNEQKERLKQKRRSLQASTEKLPPQARARIDSSVFSVNDITCDLDDKTTTTSSNTSSSPATANCVICQVAPSSQAIIPCGHCCLCDECATTLTVGPPQTRLCPLCRTQMQSCLKIFLSAG